MRVALVVALFALFAGPAASAHEGHAHKIMGTVASVRASRLEIKATDGKTASVIVNQGTRILRGSSDVKLSDLKIGERVVATATETKEKTMIAQDVRVAASR
jgi:hypothetical protein